MEGENLMDNQMSDMTEFEKPASLITFFNVLFKRKKIMLTFFFSVVVVVTIGSFLIHPVYKASSTLLIEREPDSEKALLFRMNIPVFYDYDWIKSEIDIIKSHPVALQVVETLKMDQLRQDNETYSETEKENRFKREVDNFQRKLKVENDTKSNVLDISFEDNNPQLAEAVVTKVIETYLSHRSEIFKESEAYEFFEEQMRIEDEKLRDLEKYQAEYKESEGIISPEAQRDILLTRLADYEKSLTEVRTRRIGKEASLTVIKEHLKNGWAESIPVTESSDSPSRRDHITKLKGDLLDMELQLELLLQKFTPEYEEVKNLDNQISATKNKIEQEINEIIEMEGTAIQSLKAEEGVLQTSIDKIKNEIKNYSQKEYELTQLSRGIDDTRETYSMLLKVREEARISLAKIARGVKIRIVSPAFVLPDPVRPRKALNIILSVFLGLLGGLGLAFFVEHIDHSVSSPAELEQLKGLNVLGSIRDIGLKGLEVKEEKLKTR
jgi:uncharacterized protein involved in exopolysaccharide biosynthesis